jgi:hypothetical protein
MWLTGSSDVRRGIVSAFRKFIDYNVSLGKFDSFPAAEHMFVHPLCTRDVKEITTDEPGRKWAYVQSDVYGNLLEVMSSVGDRRRADIMLGYLEKISFWGLKDYGFWECDEPMVHASSLAACLRGIEKYKSSFGRGAGEMRISGYDSLRSVLQVGESLVRESDLATMSLLYPGGLDKDIIDARVRRGIWGKLECLEGEQGYKRFIADGWDGIIQHDGYDGRDRIRGGHEMRWVMGGAWKALVTGDQDDKDRAVNVWRKYGSPEGFVPVDRTDLSKGWILNCTPLLFWTLGMQLAMLEI